MISKWFLVSTISSKKTNERIRLYYYDTSSRLVLEEIEDTKKPIRNYLTFNTVVKKTEAFNCSIRATRSDWCMACFYLNWELWIQCGSLHSTYVLHSIQFVFDSNISVEDSKESSTTLNRTRQAFFLPIHNIDMKLWVCQHVEAAEGPFICGGPVVMWRACP